MEANETHEKIITIIKEKGPSLPIQIAKKIGISSLFISAFLSELANEKRIRISNLKVGGSPLYFLEGQEESLESYYKFLHPREAETFLLLKKNKVLKDSEQEPVTRVALRSIKDFAVGFSKNNEIYWKYVSTPQSEIDEILTPTPIKKALIKPKPTIPEKKPEIKPEPKIPEKTSKKEQPSEFQNPFITQKPLKIKKQKEKSEFVTSVMDFLSKNNLEIINEISYKAKEYDCKIQMNSQLGPLTFLTQAKDKKTISETDLKKLLSNAQSIPIPALVLYTGNISKKAQEYQEKYSSILKLKKII